MNKDLIYVFDKITGKRSELGEIQANFNMSFVIDGTKDSTQLVIWSFNQENTIEPYTILWHAKTDTWWCAKHDKVERYLNDNDTFLYVHTMQLNGAKELFSARDLTDCGFNQKTYTFQDFINRLFSMSNFEYSIGTIHASANFLAQKVEFVKAFENYSLASALREFLDGYNMEYKLLFNQSQYLGNFYLSNCVLNIIPKTGDNSITALDISAFDDVRESKTIDSNSFGTCVVSNAENVISSIAKTYPSTGTVKLSSSEYNIKPENALIRLPSAVYKGNWIKMTYPVDIRVESSMAGSGAQTMGAARYVPYNVSNYEKFVEDVCALLPVAIQDREREMLLAKKGELQPKLNALCTITLYEGNKVVPYYGANNNSTGSVIIEKGDNVPYLSVFSWKNGESKLPHIFTDKETRGLLAHKEQGIYWERGSNIITGFECLKEIMPLNGGSVTIENTDYQSSAISLYKDIYATDDDYVELKTLNDINIEWKKTAYIISYIPMSNIKIKVDNTRDKRDVQLYNQNGKLTDNVALSKLINSYAREISSDTITRYMNYYRFSDVPKVGTIVNKGNEYYVINNVSMDFSQNEKSNGDFGYFIEAEITMSKYVSTKSLMVNPNTNIRDYGIPQNFNVKRKQLYRDYYEIGYSVESGADNNYYLKPENVFRFGITPNEQNELVAVIQLDYDIEINNGYNWYYQLETTTYNMNKMFYIVCDFNDNNIIGYSNQNVFSGFVISRIFKGLTDLMNTPISYVDENGQFKGVDLLLLDNEQLTSIYEDYLEEQSSDPDYSSFVSSGVALYNYSCFIPQDIYLKARASEDNWKIRITESSFVAQGTKDYNKDAIEVPVFEYCCQINDSENVLIGDNILTQHDNCTYFYHFIVGDNLTQDNVYDNSSLMLPTAQNPYRYRMRESAKVVFGSNQITVNIYSYTQWNTDTNTWTDYLPNNIPTNRDLAVFRHAYNSQNDEEIVELLFIAKKIPNANVSADGKTLTLNVNHWKLN